MSQADIGLVGLAVMGENLALNMADHGFTIAVYNRTPDKMDRFLRGRARGKSIVGARTIETLAGLIKRPRKIMLMVKAGTAVDQFIDLVLPFLDAGDILVDGGNSHFLDTDRRAAYVEGKGLLYVGCGVSGGEEGALTGPSIMPGGSEAAWPVLRPILQAIAAHVDDGRPCCDWIGPRGAGHFIKMVHNGIEYGDMQLICEAYHIMKALLGLDNDDMSEIFKQWNAGDLDSYLIEITGDILAYRDASGEALVDKILDVAGQKGTGKWTGRAAFDLGVPLTLIGEAVFSRCLAAMKEDRMAASGVFTGPDSVFEGDREAFLDDLEQALYASKLVSYAQGYALMKAGAREYGWDLDYGGIALVWRGGCIIRSAFLGRIKEAYAKDPSLPHLLLDPFFSSRLVAAQAGWRRVVAGAVTNGIPLPAMSAALAYYDGFRSDRLPANLLQAQRDYFGAHTYERIDGLRGEFHHTDWTGRGGSTASTTYNA